MQPDRHVHWDGCVNGRDLGGLPTGDGRQTRWGALVRSDSPHRLTAAGWRSAWDHGIRTVVDLRHRREQADARDLCPRPAGISVVHSSLEDETDLEFVERWGAELATPRYYADALARFSDRSAAMVRAVARAEPGGVLLHCVIGRDRTGLASLLLLALVGVSAEEIAIDHALSYGRTSGIDPHPELCAGLPDAWEADHQATIAALLAEIDVEAYLRDTGVDDIDLSSVRRRLVG